MKQITPTVGDLRLSDLKIGDALPVRQHTPTSVSLFMYNAAIWNSHRIHYDEKYTTEVEKHPAIVIDGPLQGDWLSQVVLNWLGVSGQLLSFSYSNRRASYLGETLTSGGRIVAIDMPGREVAVELFVTNENQEVTSPGSAVVRIS